VDAADPSLPSPPLRASVPSSLRASDSLFIEVSDTGIGIAPELLGRIFEPFEQGAQERRSGGLGLGLAICRSLVAAHGGEITAQSEGPGRGATFVVELPMVTAEMESKIAPEMTTGPRALRVLVVEDHEATRSAVERVLALLGHEPVAVDSVRAAIRAAERGRFDLLISDLGLPDGTGHELMREVRQRYGLPGIALSGYGREEDEAQSRQAGFALHLTKPIDPEELQAAIARVGDIVPKPRMWYAGLREEVL
jgi:CheY-like chemotaxis protein